MTEQPQERVVPEKYKEQKRTPFERFLRRTYGSQKGQVEFLLHRIFDYEREGLKRGGFLSISPAPMG